MNRREEEEGVREKPQQGGDVRYRALVLVGGSGQAVGSGTDEHSTATREATVQC